MKKLGSMLLLLGLMSFTIGCSGGDTDDGGTDNATANVVSEAQIG